MAGNCESVEHDINLILRFYYKADAATDLLYKMWEEVDRIIEDMKEQGVIEES